MENEEADAGRDGRSGDQNLRREWGQGRRKKIPVQLTTSRIGNLVCMVTHIARVWINGVRLPILHVVSRTGKMDISLSAFATENLVSRGGFGSPLYCMYGHTYSKSMDQPGKVASPARGQLNRKNEYFPVHVRARQFGLARRVRQSRPASACSSPYSG